MGLLSNYLHKVRTNLVSPYVQGDVLDVGCGPATNYKLAKNRINKYYGVEYSQETVNKLKEKYPELTFVQKDLDNDPLDFDITFDRILLIAVIEHIFNQKHLIEQLIKNLKPDGKLIVTTPTPFGNDVVHRWGRKIGLFSKQCDHDDHIVIYNKTRFKILAKSFNLNLEEYKTFEFGGNQLAVFSKKIA